VSVALSGAIIELQSVGPFSVSLRFGSPCLPLAFVIDQMNNINIYQIYADVCLSGNGKVLFIRGPSVLALLPRSGADEPGHAAHQAPPRRRRAVALL
jgi:hypothetical protein